MAPGAHAMLLLDQAGWHTTGKLAVPANTTLLPLPPRCPELNPQENVWQFIRENWLSNRIFQSYADTRGKTSNIHPGRPGPFHIWYKHHHAAARSD